jgi:hypothetical protein
VANKIEIICLLRNKRKMEVKNDSDAEVVLDSVQKVSKRINYLLKKIESEEIIDQPIFVGKLKSLELWDQYAFNDNVSLNPKYLFLDDHLYLYIIELPTEKHEFMSAEILLQLIRQSRYIRSFGSGRTNHIEADQRITSSYDTPKLQIPQGTTLASLSTLVVEVGLSQNWNSLDEKAKKWFQLRDSLGLQYILCVKIDINNQRSISDISFKLYDINNFQAMDPTHLFLEQNLVFPRIQLDAKRILSIPDIPIEFNGKDFIIDLEEIRDEIIIRGI